MAKEGASGLSKGGLSLSIIGGIMIILALFFSLWGPKNTAITKSTLITIAQTSKFWYLYFVPIFGIICMALAGSSYISETRGTGAASGILGFAVLLINFMFLLHNSYINFGSKDILGYFKTGFPYLRIGWFFIFIGSLFLIIGGACLSSAFKPSRAVKTKERPVMYPARQVYPQQTPQPSAPSQVAVTVTIPQDEMAKTEEEEEEKPESTEFPVPAEDMLPPPRDDIPPPPVPDEKPDDEPEEEEEEEEEEEPEEEEKLNIEKGYNHLILEDSSKNAFEALKSLTWDDTKGLVLSTMFPSKIDKEYGLEKIEKIWISHSSGNDISAIDPKRLEFEITRAISNFMKDKGSVILIDGLEYLVVENGFENVLKFLKKMGDLSSVNDCTLIISVNPSSLSNDQLTVLKKDFDKVHDTNKNDDKSSNGNSKKSKK